MNRSTARFCGDCGGALPAGCTCVRSRLSSGLGKSIESTIDIKGQSSNGGPNTPAGVTALERALVALPANMAVAMRAALTASGSSPAGFLPIAPDDNARAAIRDALNRLGSSIDYVCLIGDWEDIPPIRIDSPCTDLDGDEHCYSDAPYGSLSADEDLSWQDLMPTIGVGRLPTRDIATIIRLLKTDYAANAVTSPTLLAVSAQAWNKATAAILSDISGPVGRVSIHSDPRTIVPGHAPAALSSPNWTLEHLSRSLESPLQPKGLTLLFNVHGTAENPNWYGEADRSSAHIIHAGAPLIFSPETVRSFAGQVLVTEACYGGKIDYGTPSICEDFIARGGLAYVGSSTIAWGGPETPTDADLLAMRFLQEIRQGQAVGPALSAAKRHVMEACGEDSPTAEKTILSFNLYGVPWAVTHARRFTQTGTGTTQSTGSSVLNRVRQGLGQGNPSTPLLNSTRSAYMARLSDRAQRFLLDQQEAMEKIRQFPDWPRIEAELRNFGVVAEDCKVEKLTRGSKDSFLIRGSTATGTTAIKHRFVLTVNAQGQLTRTSTTKSFETNSTGEQK